MGYQEEIDALVPIVEWLAGIPEREIPSFSLQDIDWQLRLLRELKVVVIDRTTKKPRLSKWAQDRWAKMTAREMLVNKWARMEQRRARRRAGEGPVLLPPY